MGRMRRGAKRATTTTRRRRRRRARCTPRLSSIVSTVASSTAPRAQMRSIPKARVLVTLPLSTHTRARAHTHTRNEPTTNRTILRFPFALRVLNLNRGVRAWHMNGSITGEAANHVRLKIEETDTTVCFVCHSQLATNACKQCADAFCAGCYSLSHSKGVKAKHTPVVVVSLLCNTSSTNSSSSTTHFRSDLTRSCKHTHTHTHYDTIHTHVMASHTHTLTHPGSCRLSATKGKYQSPTPSLLFFSRWL